MHVIYTLHRRSEDPPEEIVFVREGFAWWAVLFGPLWFLYHRLYWLALAALVISGGLPFALAAFGQNEVAQSLIGLVVTLLIAASANDLWRWDLNRRGFDEIDLIGAPDLETAEEIYFRRQASATPADPATPTVQPRHSDLTPFADPGGFGRP